MNTKNTKKTLAQNINQFLFEEISPLPLSCFRIAFGLYLLVYFLHFLPNIELMFSNLGVYSPLFIPDIAPSPTLACLIYCCTLGFITCFILGYKTWLSTPLVLISFLWHYFLNFGVRNCSYDRLIILFLILMCLGACQLNKGLSIENRGKNNINDQKISAWLTRLLCIQVSIFYFGTGFYKSFALHWQTGDILKMTFASNWGTPASFGLLALNLPDWFYDLTVKIVIYAELIMGFGLWIRFWNIQRIFFILGLFFHLSVWIFINIPEFMLCIFTYFLFMSEKDLQTTISCLGIKSSFSGNA